MSEFEKKFNFSEFEGHFFTQFLLIKLVKGNTVILLGSEKVEYFK